MKVFNKLVRDKIPEIIESENRKCEYYALSDEEYKKELKLKLLEEVNEYLNDDNIEELADIAEVVYALVKTFNLDDESFNEIREKKANKRGRFEKKYFLVKSD